MLNSQNTFKLTTLRTLSRMNTIQIHKVLTKHVNYFQDVHPLDLLPSTLIKPAIIVISLDKHYMPSSHWVAVCFTDFGYAEYYDSCGLPPYKLEIVAYLLLHSICWIFNRHRLQGLTSNVLDITAACTHTT